MATKPKKHDAGQSGHRAGDSAKQAWSHVDTVWRTVDGVEREIVCHPINHPQSIREAALIADALNKAAAPKDPRTFERLTVTDAIDAFPVLRGIRTGISSRPDRRPFIDKGEAFIDEATRRGGGAMNAAMMLCELTGAFYVKGERFFDWQLALSKLDGDHRAALAFVVSRWIAGGGF